MEKGKMFIVSGPSGVGKNTIVDIIVADSKNIEESVSMTTRKMREKEIEGESYHFVTKKEFMKAVENDEMLEWAEFSGNLYGTPKKSVLPKLEKGIDIISVVEVKGAALLIERLEALVSIFLMPPSEEELENRLKKRNTDKEEYILRRLNEAKMEMQLADEYDYIVTNDDLEETIKKIKNIIKQN